MPEVFQKELLQQLQHALRNLVGLSQHSLSLSLIHIFNAGRKFLGIPAEGNLAGKLFVSSGLGGMSGAQPKAAEIAGAVGVFAEVDESRIKTRHDQGWVSLVSDNLPQVFQWAKEYMEKKAPCLLYTSRCV